MSLFRTEGNPTFFGTGNSAEVELAALRELQLRVSKKDRMRIQRDIRAMSAGIAGEKKVHFELENSHMPLCIIQDLYLEHLNLSAQIDFLVITPYVCIVLECKNLYGDITIDEHGAFVRKAWGRSEGIYSPITQNERHIELMKQIRISEASGLKRKVIEHFFDDNYKSLVVLANDETVLFDHKAPRGVRELVVRRDALIEHIRKMNDAARKAGNPRSSFQEMREMAEGWLGRASEHKVNLEGRYVLAEDARPSKESSAPARHVSSLADESWRKSRPAAPVCPICGAPMLLRTATRGPRKGKQFWGCSTYPRCHSIINID